MRVALVYRNFNLGGSLERNSVLLARSLAALGADVHCYGNPETSDLEREPVTFHPVRPTARSHSRVGYAIECATFARAATRALRRDRDRYDVVDVRGIAAWEHDVLHVHSIARAAQRRWPVEGGRGYRGARARAALAPVVRPQVSVASTVESLQFRRGRFARVIATTEQVRRDVMAVHWVPAERIDVIPPPIDLERFGHVNGGDLRRNLRIGRDDPVLLFVGHSFERKGLGDAIGALARLGPTTHLVVLGRGDPISYRRRAHELGVGSRVHFVGESEAPAHFFREADVFVLPTRQDRWGIPLIEAMAAGLPVVTTAVAGAADEVRANDAGLVLPDSTPQPFAEAIASLLVNPERRREMGERGRVAARRFDAAAQARAVLGIYREVLDERLQTNGRHSAGG